VIGLLVTPFGHQKPRTNGLVGGGGWHFLALVEVLLDICPFRDLTFISTEDHLAKSTRCSRHPETCTREVPGQAGGDVLGQVSVWTSTSLVWEVLDDVMFKTSCAGLTRRRPM
jgi:hypothetical protein